MVNKILNVVLLLVIGGLILFTYNVYREKKDLTSLLQRSKAELMAANLEIGRAKTSLVDQKKLYLQQISKLEKDIQKEIEGRKAAIELVASLKAKLKTAGKGKIIIKKVNICDNNGNKLTSLPFSFSDFRLKINGDAIKQTLNYKLSQHFRAKLVETRLPNGAINHYVSIWETDGSGKDIAKLELESFEVLKAKNLNKRMFYFNPKLDVGIGVGFDLDAKYHWSANLGISLSSYGETLDDSTLRFFRFGLGVSSNKLVSSFSPIQFNLGKLLPLISNFYLSPEICYIIRDKEIAFGFNLSAVL